MSFVESNRDVLVRRCDWLDWKGVLVTVINVTDVVGICEDGLVRFGVEGTTHEGSVSLNGDRSDRAKVGDEECCATDTFGSFHEVQDSPSSGLYCMSVVS